MHRQGHYRYSHSAGDRVHSRIAAGGRHHLGGSEAPLISIGDRFRANMTDREKAGLHGHVRTVRHGRGVPAHLTVEWFNPEGARVMSENEYADGSVSQIEYVYDSAGRLLETRSDDDDGSRTYEYAARGRLGRVYEQAHGPQQLR